MKYCILPDSTHCRAHYLRRRQSKPRHRDVVICWITVRIRHDIFWTLPIDNQCCSLSQRLSNENVYKKQITRIVLFRLCLQCYSLISSSCRPSHSLSLIGRCSSPFHRSWAGCDWWTRSLPQCAVTSVTHLHRLLLINRLQRGWKAE